MLVNLPQPLTEQTLDSFSTLVFLYNSLYGDKELISRHFDKSFINSPGPLKGGVGNFYEKLRVSNEISANEFLDNHHGVLPLY
jgi:hypothetical protein